MNDNPPKHGEGGRRRASITGAVALAIIAGILVLAVAAYGAVEWYTAQSSFCGGSCHTMTEQYDAWKRDTHHGANNDGGVEAGCVDCHFLPGEHGSLKAKYEGLRHLAAYLYDSKAPLPIRPVVPDGACLQSGCHDKNELAAREIQFTEKARFKHDVHLGDEALSGHSLACDSCHMKVSEKRHFEVPEDICFLCHLKLDRPLLETAEMAEMGAGKIMEISFAARPKTDFNQGLSRCDICHTIPTEPLQRQLSEEDTLTKEVVTHQSIAEAAVPCESCHFEVVKGTGEIEIGNVVSNGCFRCHNRSEELVASAHDGELMHTSHVDTRKADCFDCHNTVEHRNRTDHLDFVRNDCELCHADQHRFQKVLLAGIPVNENLSATPHLMYEVNTNCLGCHLKKTQSAGHPVRTASGETCVACHTERHGDMLNDWKAQISDEIAGVEDYEAEVTAAFESARETLDTELAAAVENAVREGKSMLDIVRFGNGVHNKKYAIMIMDEVYAKFDEAMDLLGDAAD